MKPGYSRSFVLFAALTLGASCKEKPPQELEISVQLPGGASMEMVWTPPGKFKMGGVHPMWKENERPAHKVQLTKGFYL